ncbi:MAG: 2-oxo acid dehydrogenase subunit E2 [Elusimicrobia bacterium]|nr:2-oxo acid dehydrogenase subunit E2 [Elusimicrobiota bacterium]
MQYDFKLPDIGEGLTEGEVVKWHVREGDSIRENQPLVNVLTDKAEVEIPSPKTGKILKFSAQEGQKVKVGETLVTFDLSGNGATAAGSLPPAGTINALPPLADTARGSAQYQAASESASPPGGSQGLGEGRTASALPAVRKLAAELNVDLAQVRGTGPGGRITEENVRNSACGGRPTGAENDMRPEERVPFVGIRRRTAEKMALSKRTVAHVTHMDEADLSALVALREELKAEAERRGVKLTFLPFILLALVKSLREFPNLNATLEEGGGANGEPGSVVRKKYYNIGVATAAEQGLVVPVLKDADRKDLWALAADVNRLTEKVRANKIEASELQGGTFTVTNVGPIGGLFATPIVNHPEVAILGVMKIQKRPVVRDGTIVARDMVNLVLSFDHRVLDGAEAAQFMNMLIRRLENPRTLL